MTIAATSDRHARIDGDPERRTDIRHYAVFGGVLRTTLDFPELTPCTPTVADWTLRVNATGAPLSAREAPLGERVIGQERYRLSRTDDGFRLRYSHAGAFDISAMGSEITCHPAPDAVPELVRSIVLGPVLALSLESAGYICLHGSAVAIGHRAVAFLAPKYHGKSTLALALTAAGAKFISDDTLVVRSGERAMMRPGIGSARVWEDVANHLRVDRLCRTVMRGVKTTAAGFAGHKVLDEPVPLAALYVLHPVGREDAEAPCRRSPLAPMEAAVACAHHTKLPDPLVGYEAAGARLRSMIALAASVPAYTLHVARDFERLPAVTQQLLAWHAGSAGAALPASR